MRPPERSVRFPQGGAHPANAGMLFLVFFRALSYFRGPTGWMSTQTKDQGLQYLATTPGLHFPLLLKLRRNPQATHESPSLILGHVCPFISGMLGKKQQRCLPVGGYAKLQRALRGHSCTLALPAVFLGWKPVLPSAQQGRLAQFWPVPVCCKPIYTAPQRLTPLRAQQPHL